MTKEALLDCASRDWEEKNEIFFQSRFEMIQEHLQFKVYGLGLMFIVKNSILSLAVENH